MGITESAQAAPHVVPLTTPTAGGLSGQSSSILLPPWADFQSLILHFTAKRPRERQYQRYVFRKPSTRPCQRHNFGRWRLVLLLLSCGTLENGRRDSPKFHIHGYDIYSSSTSLSVKVTNQRGRCSSLQQTKNGRVYSTGIDHHGAYHMADTGMICMYSSE